MGRNILFFFFFLFSLCFSLFAGDNLLEAILILEIVNIAEFFLREMSLTVISQICNNYVFEKFLVNRCVCVYIIYIYI